MRSLAVCLLLMCSAITLNAKQSDEKLKEAIKHYTGEQISDAFAFKILTGMMVASEEDGSDKMSKLVYYSLNTQPDAEVPGAVHLPQNMNDRKFTKDEAIEVSMRMYKTFRKMEKETDKIRLEEYCDEDRNAQSRAEIGKAMNSAEDKSKAKIAKIYAKFVRSLSDAAATSVQQWVRQSKDGFAIDELDYEVFATELLDIDVREMQRNFCDQAIVEGRL